MSVTAAQGFVAGGAAAGIKADGSLDLALVDAGHSVPAAAVFTSNTAAAAPVQLSRRHIADGTARAVVLTSGCANAATGAEGMAAAERVAELVADHLGCDPTEVVVCSTGPIGTRLPTDRVAEGLSRLKMSREGAADAARAIMTTDSRPKEAVARGQGYVVGGMAKGAGMIRPDMATMLAVITTDARLDSATLGRALRRAVDRSFNALDIDGCESTNDTVVLLASGMSGIRPDEEAFGTVLEKVCRDLARQMAEDAEGASRVVTIELSGASDDETALALARAIADSALVRSSFYGADPNWGRLLAAMGATRLPLDPSAVTIAYAGVVVAEGGVDAGADPDLVSEKLEDDFTVSIRVGDGPGRCELLTTDLTPDYVVFNGERS
ncbi:MAG: bifunctional glutamate N-acetyltransferase/amino-acid acetyltransferase ArgJ [Actinomycetes bacterium]|nr:bifunctional glutamate N-acetyltransferase/amino-acid acetyltransferase ArgJ [Acidimicrobiia bacterium]